MMKLKLYEVGGKVRDEILGIKSNDVDFSVVLPDDMLKLDPQDGFDFMTMELKTEGYQIFLSTPDCFTIRAKFPKGHVHEGLVADFVLARKEICYYRGTRRPIIKLGTLEDDLIRRDFTLNAIAKDLDGTLIDPFNGIKDLNEGVLRTPTDPQITMLDDPLRVLRAIRFVITKDFSMEGKLALAIHREDVQEKLFKVVSQERIREELNKMLSIDTYKTLYILEQFGLTKGIFKNGLKLEATTKK